MQGVRRGARRRGVTLQASRYGRYGPTFHFPPHVATTFAKHTKRTPQPTHTMVMRCPQAVPRAPPTAPDGGMWDLAQSTAYVATTCPLGVWEPVGVHPECDMHRLAAEYDIPDLAVALGANYFQRIIERRTDGLWHLTREGWLVPAPKVKPDAKPPPAGPTRVLLRGRASSVKLMCVYATCVVIATKLVDRLRYARQLSSMIKDICGALPDADAVTTLELDCLARLGWDLGRFAP